MLISETHIRKVTIMNESSAERSRGFIRSIRPDPVLWFSKDAFLILISVYVSLNHFNEMSERIISNPISQVVV